jgi:acyl-CoA thioester hydrolase
MEEGLTRAPEVVSSARVRYADTDRMGVAYYANYLVWFEVGRTEWMRASGSSYRDIEEAGFLLPVIEAQCEYRQPLRYDDELEIRTRGRLVTPVRVEFQYEVVRRADLVVAAVGRTTHASTDTEGRPRRLPASLRKLFS